ncbi:MAG: hypothetical protein GXY01_06700 [Clostridiales bacterium]|mgnify:CR=1 FL=1|jgi:hypothetical protein|nr:hypothetical protein [Clostridiales bacterium]
MSKWDYIRLISSRGDRRGCNGGVYDLLQWCGKRGTIDVTEDEAKQFFEMINLSKNMDSVKKRASQ